MLRYAGITSGALCVMTLGPLLMRKWLADNWAFQQQVNRPDHNFITRKICASHAVSIVKLLPLHILLPFFGIISLLQMYLYMYINGT